MGFLKLISQAFPRPLPQPPLVFSCSFARFIFRSRSTIWTPGTGYVKKNPQDSTRPRTTERTIFTSPAWFLLASCDWASGDVGPWVHPSVVVCTKFFSSFWHLFEESFRALMSTGTLRGCIFKFCVHSQDSSSYISCTRLVRWNGSHHSVVKN